MSRACIYLDESGDLGWNFDWPHSAKDGMSPIRYGNSLIKVSG